MERYPEKTFIGPIERGFDFLGYHFRPDRLSVPAKTIENFVARAIRLSEQEPEEAFASARFGIYVRRWVAWSSAGRGAASPGCGRLPPGRQTNLTGAYQRSRP